MNGAFAKFVVIIAATGVLGAVGVFGQQLVNCERIKNLEVRIVAVEKRQETELKAQREMFAEILNRLIDAR